MGKISEFLRTISPLSEDKQAQIDAIQQKIDDLNHGTYRDLRKQYNAADSDEQEPIQKKMDAIVAQVDRLKDQRDALKGKSETNEADAKEVQSVLTALNSSSSMGGKYPIGNKEFTAKVKSMESSGLIQYDDKADRWSKGKKKAAGKEIGEDEELSQEVQDKIKANNDKMSALKAKGGSQEEIDALEKENDELNGGSKTATMEACVDEKEFTDRDALAQHKKMMNRIKGWIKDLQADIHNDKLFIKDKEEKIKTASDEKGKNGQLSPKQMYKSNIERLKARVSDTEKKIKEYQDELADRKKKHAEAEADVKSIEAKKKK